MRTLISMMVVTCFIGTALSQQADNTPKLQREHREMAIWVGDWTYTGKILTTPLGPGGMSTGRMTARHIPNRLATKAIYDGAGPQGNMHGQEVCWYQPGTKNYDYRFHSDNGYIERGSFKINKNEIAWKATCEQNNRRFRIRGTDTYVPDGKSFIRAGEILSVWWKWQPYVELQFAKVEKVLAKRTVGKQKMIKLEQDCQETVFACDSHRQYLLVPVFKMTKTTHGSEETAASKLAAQHEVLKRKLADTMREVPVRITP